ncbi:hypothetical protein MTDSW087_05227 [Methylobacterium dankookense]|uniref:Uncharacterized protein n=1 Tax=Methylobacterium dankookense TaxID=560405 RepID=A0A564G598_9HYPH|nr:hypothetical protein IFDJLNFL_3476 [Methylobacterium dankookense]VUF15487.1 hypothetical protein MTDSW087_05227 [Methylobacterium dankookense]
MSLLPPERVAFIGFVAPREPYSSADEQRIIDLYVRAGLIPQARAPRAEAIRDPGFSEALAAVR